MAAALQILFMRRHFRRKRVFRDRTNPLDVYNAEDMIKRYRFLRATVLELIDRVSPMIQTPTRHSMSISTSTQVKFTNVVVRWPGGTHDAFILQQSGLFRHMEALVDNGWLLGDSGYPLKSWLLTPLGNPSTPQELRFQKAHCKTRNTVERAFGVLKQRFRCLHKTGGALSYKPERGTNTIESCFRLHNLALDNNVPLNRDPPLPLLQDNHVFNQQNTAANALRNEIILKF
ncbi:HARBI1 [Mytilus coruscus]|uniref:HARBI1 n=1 Tax=Mytilus coruscus TaxID=42192 RepID=A0A6J8EHF4_MYTCO|nr:HARBI1 [Mytilus coruscus]